MVQENGTPIVGSCQINWTITKEGSPIFQKSSSCQAKFDTGLVLGVGNYEVIAEVTTGSGTEWYAHLNLYVENALENTLHSLLAYAGI